jgi:proteic killer suppression protein
LDEYTAVIISFNDKESEKIFNGYISRKLPATIQTRAFTKLTALHAAASLEDLRIPPSNHLEALKGDRIGQHSMRINDQYRVCFEWNGSDAENVEIVNYH